MSLGAAALIAGSSLGGALIQATSAQMINALNARYQEEANRISQDLANTAHQREVADLRAAGLNPILSAGGSGAAVPQIGAVQAENPYGGLANSATAVGRELGRLASQQYKLQNEQMEAQTLNLHSSRSVIESEAELKKAMADSIRAGRSIPEFMRPAAESFGDWIGSKIGISSAEREAHKSEASKQLLIPYKGRYVRPAWLMEHEPAAYEQWLSGRKK